MFTPTADFPSAGFPDLSLPPAFLRTYNLLTHHIGSSLFRGLSANGYPMVRKKHPHWPQKLLWPFDSTTGHPPSPLLLGISPQILPPSPDWQARHIHLTGYWYLDDQVYQPSASLSAFLAAGEMPVCVGFGSMIHPHSTHIQRSLLTALRQERQRALILTGWDGWQKVRGEFSEDDFFYLDSAPHEWLFPLCKLIIHHGGAGTIAAALRAGIPQWVIPFTADQPFWASRVYRAGVALTPVTPNRIRPHTIAPVLQPALHDASFASKLRQRARELGEKIRSEDGVGRAVEVITQTASK